MYAVDGKYDYSARHPASPPLSVDSGREHRNNSVQYLNNYQPNDDRYGYERNPVVDLSYSHNDPQSDDNFGYPLNYRSSEYPSDRRGPAGQDNTGTTHPYLSSPYGSEMEGSYGVEPSDNRFIPRYPSDVATGHPQSSLQNVHRVNSPQEVMGVGGQYRPYHLSGRPNNERGLDEPYSDQMSGSRDEINPLDERFSEQDTVPLDERLSDLAAVNQYGLGQGQYNERGGAHVNQWDPSSQQQRREENNFADSSLRNSMIRLSVQDIRPGVSPTPFLQAGTNSSVPPLNISMRRSPSTNSQLNDSKWRNPDLREVIDYLNHQNDAVKANAAAYLQHLCYMDDNIKAQTRVLRGIPALVDLVNNPLPEVHRAACGALRNLSYGRANDENKREIKNAGGITVLARLLRTTTDNDVREVVTGILWNLSSCADLKKPIIDEGVKSVVDKVIVPTSGWDRVRGGPSVTTPTDFYRLTVFRNASGVLRNVSSDGEYARMKLRECEGLVDSIVLIVQMALTHNDIDNKSVENCVCLLRNLSYACQEVADPNYLKKRLATTTTFKAQDDTTGCFGKQKKKKTTSKIVTAGGNNGQYKNQIPHSHPVRGMELLWNPDIVKLYLSLLQDCSNPDTLEAAAGAIQNLAACDWQPSEDIRNAVRIEKGILIIVDLVKESSDRVICAAATALRNLALNDTNKQLIGKYSMHDMVSKLPSSQRAAPLELSNETIAALEVTLYEVIKCNSTFAKTLMEDGGIERLMFIARSELGIFNEKVIRYASQLLMKMWSFSEFHDEYRRKGWKQSDFLVGSTVGKSQPPSAENTINRVKMGQSGPSVPGYNDRTMMIERHPQQRHYDDGTVPNVAFSPGPHADRLGSTNVYSSQNQSRDNIALSRMEYPTNNQSRDVLYYNSNDNVARDSEERLNYPPRYDLPVTYPIEPPKYDAQPYVDNARNYAASQSDHYSVNLEDAYRSQSRNQMPESLHGGFYAGNQQPDSLLGGVYGRDHVSNSSDSQNRETNYRPGYDESSINREHEPLYARVRKQDQYGDLHIETAENKGPDVDSWV